MTPKPSSSFVECSIPTLLHDYDNASSDDSTRRRRERVREEIIDPGRRLDCRDAISDYHHRGGRSELDLRSGANRSVVGSDSDEEPEPSVSILGVSFSGSYDDIISSPSSSSLPLSPCQAPRHVQHDEENRHHANSNNSSPAVTGGSTAKTAEPGNTNNDSCENNSRKHDPLTLTPNSVTKASSVCTGTISTTGGHHGHSTTTPAAERRYSDDGSGLLRSDSTVTTPAASRGFRLMRFGSGRVRRFLDPFPTPAAAAAAAATSTSRPPDDVPRRELSFVSMAGSSAADLSDAETSSSTIADGPQQQQQQYSRIVSETPPAHTEGPPSSSVDDDLTVCTPEPAPAEAAAANKPEYHRDRLTPRTRRVRLLAAVASPRIRDSLRRTRGRIGRLRLRRRERPRPRPRTSGWLIPADHPVKVGWDVCTVLLSMISAYLTHTSIRDRHYDKDHFLIRFCELWFFVDICLNFFTQHRTGRRVLFSVQSVWARYLTTWFIIDAISFLPWEKVWVKPIVEMQKRRNIVQKTMRRSKVVFKITRMLRGRHVRWFQHVTRHTRHAGVGSRRLLNMMIKYIPKYFVFLKNMRGVLAVRMLRQIHWCRKVMKNLCRRRNGVEEEEGDEHEDEYELIEDDDDGGEEEEDEYDEHIVRHEELLKLGVFDADPRYHLKQD